MTEAKAIKPHERLAAACADEMDAVNTLIRARMASDHAPRIPEVTAHLVEAGGKRVRPLLTVASAKMCGATGQDHIKLAATVEFIHTATLLHDDVVDESDQRRGRPTANLLWDNQSSVLVGDYLFARAFQLMVETGSLRILDILSGAAATIAEGEVLQLTAARNLATTEATYLQVVRGKTAALFEAAAQVGGVVAKAPEDHVTALAAFGDALGVSFQIVDDWLDYGGAGDGIGKNLGDDFREGKLTLPVIRALERGSEAERTFWRENLELAKSTDDALAHARTLLAQHGTLEETRLEALAWRDRAKAALDRLPSSDLRDMLADLADYVVARAH
ncbi:MAG: polyprenyl synthetase family protein [Pseudomonadota bacterium]